jgi:hypothetical protein
MEDEAKSLALCQQNVLLIQVARVFRYAFFQFGYDETLKYRRCQKKQF